MSKKRTEILMIVVALLALGAGVAGGLLAARLPQANAATTGEALSTPGGPDRTPLTDELELSADQRAEMRTIWESVRNDVHTTFERARDIENKREAALVALLTDEQKLRFEKLAQDYATQFDALSAEREKLFESAVERTKKLLNDSQRAKYEKILQTRGPGAPPPIRGLGRPSGPTGAGPSR